jgi:thiosulfate/3-mercaptopyruvate sulfurtransferase
MTDTRAAHLISAASLLHAPTANTVVLDVRVTADGRPDPDAYQRGHIPGARFVDLDTELAGPVTPRSGARPLPEPDDLSTTLGQWGVELTTPVVVYDGSNSAAAARAWWVLRWAGVRDVRLLGGGLRAWTAAGGHLETGSGPQIEPVDGSDARVRPGSLPTVDIGQIAEVTQRSLLIDARPAESFHGRDGSGGHIPGAVNAPVFDDFDTAGMLRPTAELAARYRGIGLTSVDRTSGGDGVVAACYCSSGVAAALQVWVLATLGLNSALFPGSLSQWVSDPARLTIGFSVTTRPHPTSHVADAVVPNREP